MNSSVGAAAESLALKIDQTILDKKLVDLKEIDLSNAIVNVWVAKVSTSNKSKRFSVVKRLKVHDESKLLFKSYVSSCIQGNGSITELRGMYTVQDDRFFYIESAATDLSQLVDVVSSAKLGVILSQGELNGYNSYVIQLTFGSPERSLFAFRYIKGAWSVKKTSGKFLSFEMLANDLVVKIQQDHRFEIAPYIDFIQFGDDVFISDIRQFETAMNYHDRLVEKKAEAITAFCSSPAIMPESNGFLAKGIGTDKHLMRQLASAHEKGYFNNEVWLAKLRKVATEAGNWLIRFDAKGNIEIDEDKTYIKELLTLLQNKRVKTVVDGVMCDVDGELIAII